MVSASTRDVSKIEWGMSDVFGSSSRHASLFLGYFSLFLADFNHLSDPVLEVALHAEENVSLVVDGYALNILQRSAESGDCLKFFTRSVDVQLVVSTVGDVERAFRKIDRLRRERITTIDDPVQLVILSKQIKHIVFVVGDVEIAAVVKDHAFRFRDAIFRPQKLRNISVLGDAEDLVHFAVADQQRAVRGKR